MRTSVATCVGLTRRTVATVVQSADLAALWEPGRCYLVRTASSDDVRALDQLGSAGVTGIVALLTNGFSAIPRRVPAVLASDNAVEQDDVVAITPGRSKIEILYRSSDLHHTVFLTNRCNSSCVMCSQPPTTSDDSWLGEEAKLIASHIRSAPDVIGFTGGEPLLLGDRLRDVLNTFLHRFNSVELDVLTNGRLLKNKALAHALLEGLPPRVFWMVPLYGHADFIHDGIVKAPCAFDETIAGLLNLQTFRQRIQLRVVLIKPVLETLPQLAAFIAKNLPFVREVALMGCEPSGFALANRDVCDVDVRAWGEVLHRATRSIVRAGIRPILMNLPLCALPTSLWALAHRSISDWKQTYSEECESCSVKSACCGLFASYAHKRGWKPTSLRPVYRPVTST